MQVQPRRVKRVVNILKDADPRFVSLVPHGANQTPFAIIKRAQALAAAEKTTDNTSSPDASSNSPASGAPAMGVQQKSASASGVLKVVFNGFKFADQESVQKWLEDNSWAGYTIAKSDIGYDAVGSHTEQTLTNIRKIAVSEGIEAHVGEIVESAAADPAAQPEAKSADPVAVVGTAAAIEGVFRKYDWYDAYFSDATTLAGVMDAGMDGDNVPPGMDAVFTALATALANILSDEAADKQAALSSLANEFATLVFKLWQLWDTWTDMPEVEQAAKIAKVKPTAAEAVRKWAADIETFITKKGAQMTGTPSAATPPAPAADPAPAPAVTDQKDAAQADPKPADPTDMIAAITKAVAESTAKTVGTALAEHAAKAETRFAELTAQIAEQGAALKAQGEKLVAVTKSVEDFGSAAPVRKGSATAAEPAAEPVDGVALALASKAARVSEEDERKADAQFQVRMRKGLLGGA